MGQEQGKDWGFWGFSPSRQAPCTARRGTRLGSGPRNDKINVALAQMRAFGRLWPEWCRPILACWGGVGASPTAHAYPTAKDTIRKDLPVKAVTV